MSQRQREQWSGWKRKKSISEICSEQLDDASEWEGQKARTAAQELCSGGNTRGAKDQF